MSIHQLIRLGSLTFEFLRYNAGFSLHIGHRKSMEDFLLIEDELNLSRTQLSSVLCIIDGHGGWECGKFVQENLVRTIREKFAADKVSIDACRNINEYVRCKITDTFYQIDLDFHQANEKVAKTCGATMIMCLMIGSRFFVFWVGDCRGFLVRENVIVQLTTDHYPSRTDEEDRIIKKGGKVHFGRLNGRVTISRSFGQFEYKNLEDYSVPDPALHQDQMRSLLSIEPQMRIYNVQDCRDNFIFLTSDGLLEGFSEEGITQFIYNRFDRLEEDMVSDREGRKIGKGHERLGGRRDTGYGEGGRSVMRSGMEEVS